MIDKDVALTLFYIVCGAQARKGGRSPPLVLLLLFEIFLKRFENLNIKITSSITQKENPVQCDLL